MPQNPLIAPSAYPEQRQYCSASARVSRESLRAQARRGGLVLCKVRNSVCRRDSARRLAAALAGLPLLAAILGGDATAQDSVATLWLDSDSYISYSDSEQVRIPEGSSLRFSLGSPASDGSIRITVDPGDVSIAPIPIAEGAAIAYTLAETAVGNVRATAAGAEIDLVAKLVASLRGRPEVPPVMYELRFTTGRAQAKGSDGRDAVAVDGTPAAPQSVQLVGAATNRSDAYPGPGEAVYAFLSGRFDRLPWAE